MWICVFPRDEFFSSTCFVLIACTSVLVWTFLTVFLLIYLQHMCVNCCTMRLVRQQPVITEQKLSNNFYKISVVEMTGVFAVNYQQNIGALKLNEQEFKMQAFNSVAEMFMNHAQRYSNICFLVVICMSGNSGYFTYHKWGDLGLDQQFMFMRSLFRR